MWIELKDLYTARLFTQTLHVTHTNLTKIAQTLLKTARFGVGTSEAPWEPLDFPAILPHGLPEASVREGEVVPAILVVDQAHQRQAQLLWRRNRPCPTMHVTPPCAS